MKTILVVSILIISIQCARADFKEKYNLIKPGDFIIEQVDPDFPVKQMEENGVHTVSIDEQKNYRETLPPSTVEYFLDKAKITQYIANWDSLEKDLLILRAENQNDDALKEHYGNLIPLKNMQLLRELIKNYRTGSKLNSK